jgi:hypothetical protein
MAYWGKVELVKDLLELPTSLGRFIMDLFLKESGYFINAITHPVIVQTIYFWEQQRITHMT